MNLANKLTMLRIFLVPVFLVFIAVKDIPYGTYIATFIFILASLTDQLDGYIARSRNEVTTFGKFMDPLADKLLVTSALISLVELGVVPSWAAIVIIAREFAVSGLRTSAAAEGKIIAASWWGKIKTVVQIVNIVMLLIQVNIMNSPVMYEAVLSNKPFNILFMELPYYILIISVAITIVSGVDYFKKNINVINTSK